MSKMDFAAELSSQLAALRDAASRYGSSALESGDVPSSSAPPPAKCRKQTARAVTPQKPQVAAVADGGSGESARGGVVEGVRRAAVGPRGETPVASNSPARQQPTRVRPPVVMCASTYISFTLWAWSEFFGCC